MRIGAILFVATIKGGFAGRRKALPGRGGKAALRRRLRGLRRKMKSPVRPEAAWWLTGRWVQGNALPRGDLFTGLRATLNIPLKWLEAQEDSPPPPVPVGVFLWPEGR
jgi:hypothetical protein